MITVTVTEKGYRAIRRGTLSIPARYLTTPPPDTKPGASARLLDPDGRFLATGYINPDSRIPFRILSFRDEQPGLDFFIRSFENAVVFRRRFYPDDEACRLIYGDSDGLPGLVIDRFDRCYVMQITTAGMEKYIDTLLKALRETVDPDAVILSCDALSRKKEGLPLYRKIAYGDPDLPLNVNVDGIKHMVDPLHTHKTGFFLDQRENRKRAAGYCSGKSVLDLFCFSGAFAVRACRAGASDVTAVDIFEPGIQLGRLTAEKLGVGNRCRFLREEVHHFLQALPDDRKWDVIFLDPPSLVRGRLKSRRNLSTYRKLNAMALKHMAPGGLFITSCCSYHVSDTDFREIVAEALFQNGRSGRIFHTGSIPPDHPIRPGSPGSDYLKCLFVQVDPHLSGSITNREK